MLLDAGTQVRHVVLPVPHLVAGTARWKCPARGHLSSDQRPGKTHADNVSMTVTVIASLWTRLSIVVEVTQAFFST